MKKNQSHIAGRTHPVEPSEPTEAEIQKEAYYLWIECGRPEGRDLEIWDAAREYLLHRRGLVSH